MSESAEWPNTFGEKPGSVRLRYCPSAPSPTRPSGVSAASRDTALIRAFGRRFGTVFAGDHAKCAAKDTHPAGAVALA